MTDVTRTQSMLELVKACMLPGVRGPHHTYWFRGMWFRSREKVQDTPSIWEEYYQRIMAGEIVDAEALAVIRQAEVDIMASLQPTPLRDQKG